MIGRFSLFDVLLVKTVFFLAASLLVAEITICFELSSLASLVLGVMLGGLSQWLALWEINRWS